MLLKGKKILITGVANDWSMAWAIAQRLAAQGAEIAMPYAMPALEKRVRPLAFIQFIQKIVHHNLLFIQDNKDRRNKKGSEHFETE